MQELSNLIWLIPALPLLGFLVITVLGKSLPKSLAGILASAMVLGSFVLSLVFFFGLQGATEQYSFKLLDWINAGSVNISLSFVVDRLSSLMLLVITGVGFLIHVYSTGYMHDDEGFNRFFSYLNLFVFFMLLLVLGDNFLVMFTGWEGVGLCSYLLIGFWFKNQDYNDAAKKAFIMNRIGDLGFVLGILLLFSHFGSFNFHEIAENAKSFTVNDPVIVAATLLLFVGAMGKSAQIPLFTWLPDAMAGPTPVSALIHAATMVTAGVYMIARSNVLFTLAPITLNVIMVIGLLTALLAAVIGLRQNDIKKVLAYSTVSQLGFMFMAMGAGAYTAGMFHLITHAFFKALLFLGAGSVIHAMGGEQDIRKMGGLKGQLKTTYFTFLIATLAISGIVPFAGFFSKDEILASLFETNKIVWVGASIASAMTAFYMFRLLFLTFFGNFRGTQHQADHLHESPASITIPLMLLAVLSTVGGFIGIPFEGMHWLHQYLEPVFSLSNNISAPHHAELSTDLMLMGIATAIAVGSIYLAYSKYVSKSEVPAEEGAPMSFVDRWIYNKFYVDEIYNMLIVYPLELLSKALNSFVEVVIIDGIVNGTGKLANLASLGGKTMQAGIISFYFFAMVVGIIAILLYNFLS